MLSPHLALNHMYLMWSTYSNLSLVIKRWIDTTASEKKCSQLYFSARLSGSRDPPQFLSQHNHWSSRLKWNICWWTCYIGLLRPYLQCVISTFNTCSWGSTHRFLTNTDGGYHPGDLGFSHHTLRPSQPMILRFLLRALSGLRLTIQPLSTGLKKSNPNLVSGSPPLDFYRSPFSKHSSD
jgi:hypothetical protein